MIERTLLALLIVLGFWALLPIAAELESAYGWAWRVIPALVAVGCLLWLSRSLEDWRPV